MKLNESSLILVAEDSDEDFDLLKIAFARSGIQNEVVRFAHGEDLLDYLFRRGKFKGTDAKTPNLIMLDLNLIGTDGRQVLADLKADSFLKKIPVIALTTSANPRDVEFCYEHSVSSYLLKPVDLDRFERLIDLFKEFWLDHAVLPDMRRKEVEARMTK